MKQLLFIIAGCITVCNVFAQHFLSGSVKDRTEGVPVEFATVALLTTDSTIITGTMTDEAGNFKLENLQEGKYLIEVSYIGYEKEYRQANVPGQSNLGEILFSKNENRLNEVVITAKRPFVEMLIDRYVVNVNNHILTAGRSALDILRYTPGVLVTPDGSISVMGSGVEIWINGRPSRLSGEALKALLRSTQGEMIDRIEIITSPSARYDASGGKIIDIKIKKGLRYGLNGSTNASYRQGHNDTENAGIALNFRETYFNVFGNYSFERNSPWQQLSQIYKMDISGEPLTFDQHTDRNTAKAYGNHQYRVGADFFLNEKHTIGLLFNGYVQGRGEESSTGNTVMTPTLDGLASSHTEGILKERMHSGLANANYQGNFGKQQLDINLDYARFGLNPSQYNRNNYFDVPGNLIGQPEELRHTNPQTIELWSATADYTTSLWEQSQLGIGGKLSGSQTDNDLQYEVMKSGLWETDTDLTNRFVYTENIHAAYISLTQSFGKWTFQAGLRGEYTSHKGEQRTLGTSETSSYFDLFPTFFARYQPSETHTWGLSYGRRVRRPDYTLLDPFEIKLDAYTYTTGNPDLKPAYTHNTQLSYLHGSLMLILEHGITNDQILQKSINNADGRHGFIPINFSKRQYISLSPNYRLSPVKFWTVNLWAQGAYATNRAPENSGEFKNDGFLFFSNIANQFVILPTLTAEMNVFFSAGQRAGYVREENPRVSVSTGIQKTFLNNKLAVALYADDLFYTNVSKASARYENVDLWAKENWDTRWVSLSVRYNFGSDKVKASRNRTTGIEDEKNRVK